MVGSRLAPLKNGEPLVSRRILTIRVECSRVRGRFLSQLCVFMFLSARENGITRPSTGYDEVRRALRCNARMECTVHACRQQRRFVVRALARTNPSGAFSLSLSLHVSNFETQERGGSYPRERTASTFTSSVIAIIFTRTADRPTSGLSIPLVVK